MGIGRASGENRAVLAAQQAIESPLLEVSIDGAKGVLFSVAGGYDVTMSEMQEAAELITASVSPDANIIWGATIKPELEDEIVITVVATGFDSVYYQDDPRAVEAYQAVENNTAEAVEEQPTLQKDYTIEADNESVEAEPQPDNTSIWNDLRNDDSDMPAILRRKKRNKQK